MTINKTKNIARSSSKEWSVDGDFIITKSHNPNKNSIRTSKKPHTDHIRFHFNLNGELMFLFNQGNYRFSLEEQHALIIYNPLDSSPFELIEEPSSNMINVFIPINRFHHLFSEDTHFMDFLDIENRNKKYYKEVVITPSQSIVLHQILHALDKDQHKILYLRAKMYELLSLIFDQQKDTNFRQCPLLSDKEHIDKIIAAKDILISRMGSPPSLPDLAEEVELSLKNLKTGFKQVYGSSAYIFLLSYKMKYACHLLKSEKLSVSETSHRLGYSTPSHFIDTFKKKFGFTPKQYSR